MIIVVGSTNPVKIHAVRKAVESIWHDVEVIGVETESGVSSQPRTDEETHQGSINRAKSALKMYYISSEGANRDAINSQDIFPLRSKSNLSKDKSSELEVTLGIGLEGGVFEAQNGEMWNTVWVTIIDLDDNMHSVNGCRFIIPEEIAAGIRAGEEMGIVASRIAGIDNIHHKEGFIGYMTHNVVDRTGEYSNLVKLAVGLWVGR